MSELKTKQNDGNIDAFLNGIIDISKKEDCIKILELMKKITNAEPKMWGDSIIGFGVYHYKYESGREGKWFLTGLSPRKQNITIYIMSGFNKLQDQLSNLGKHKTSKACLYIKTLSDVDIKILKQIITFSVKTIFNKYNK